MLQLEIKNAWCRCAAAACAAWCLVFSLSSSSSSSLFAPPRAFRVSVSRLSDRLAGCSSLRPSWSCGDFTPCMIRTYPPYQYLS